MWGINRLEDALGQGAKGEEVKPAEAFFNCRVKGGGGRGGRGEKDRGVGLDEVGASDEEGSIEGTLRCGGGVKELIGENFELGFILELADGGGGESNNGVGGESAVGLSYMGESKFRRGGEKRPKRVGRGGGEGERGREEAEFRSGDFGEDRRANGGGVRVARQDGQVGR